MKNIGTQPIETDRLLLRKITMNDAADMYNNWASDEDVAKHLTWAAHKSIDDSKEIISIWKKELEKKDCYRWCIELKESQEVIGTIDVVSLNKNLETAEIGFCISKNHWNQGITTEALIAVQNFLFQYVGLNRVEAHHLTVNPASGKIMKKAGMKFEGIKRQGTKDNKGKFADLAMYAILKSDWKKGINDINKDF